MIRDSRKTLLQFYVTKKTENSDTSYRSVLTSSGLS